MTILDRILDDIEADGDFSTEALGTQSTLTALTEAKGWGIDPAIKAAWIAAIEAPTGANDAELGMLIRENTVAYMADQLEQYIKDHEHDLQDN